MGDLQLFTGVGEKALTAFASPFFQLFFTGGVAEVGRGPAHVVDIPFKVGVFGQEPCFFQQRLVTATADASALMEGQCAEGATAKATAVGGQAEGHFF